MNSPSGPRPLFHLSRFAAAAILALLVSCATSGGGYLERDPEALGRRTGRADALAGLSQNHERHLRELDPSADEDDFEDAYDEAYNDAEDERNDGRDDDRPSAHELATGGAYESGYEAGTLDHRRGLSRNANRHDGASRGSSSISGSWIAGYEDGWNGRRR